MSNHELSTKYVLAAALALGVPALAACSANSGPEVVNTITDCGNNFEAPGITPSATAPTTEKTDPNYMDTTDPNVLLDYQMVHKRSFDQVGMGTIVCNNVNPKDTANDSKQLLSTEAIQLANLVTLSKQPKTVESN